MTRRFSLALIAFALAATPALALSCLPPDAVRLLERARDAEDSFYFVTGEIELTGPDQARITGTSLTKSGFNSPFTRQIKIETTCLGPWCGSTEGLAGKVFAAVRVANDDLTLHIGPCGGDMVFWDDGGEARVLACYLYGSCKSAD